MYERAPPALGEVQGWLLDHLDDHYDLYGESTGVRSARKHLGWYALSLPLPPGEAARFRGAVNAAQTMEEQRRVVEQAFDAWIAADLGAHADWKLAA